MRGNYYVVGRVVCRCIQISALAVFLIVSVLFILGCDDEKDGIAGAPTPTPTPCTSIDPPVFVNQGALTPLGRREACVPVGECVATLIETEKKIAKKYCERTENITCGPGTCSSGSCEAVYDADNSQSA